MSFFDLRCAFFYNYQVVIISDSWLVLCTILFVILIVLNLSSQPACLKKQT